MDEQRELQPDEVDLVGRWEVVDGRVVSDVVCRRIEHLTTASLVRLAFSREYGAWETLFRDPRDGRLWERTYPKGGMHGGGPPRLLVIAEPEARAKYDFD